MNKKKLFFFAFLLALAATPLLAMKDVSLPKSNTTPENGSLGSKRDDSALQTRSDDEEKNTTEETADSRNSEKVTFTDDNSSTSARSQESGLQSDSGSTSVSNMNNPRVQRSSDPSPYIGDNTSPPHSSVASPSIPNALQENRVPRTNNHENFTSPSSSSASSARNNFSSRYITAVSESPVDPPNPRLIESITGKINKIFELDERKRSLEEAYSAQKATIGKEAQQKIEEAQQKAELTQTRALTMGLGSSLIAGRDAKNTKKAALEKINSDAARAVNATSLNYAKQVLPFQAARYGRLFEKRLIRSGSPSTSTEEQTQLNASLPQAKIFKALGIKQRALDFLGENSERASQEDLELARQMIPAADALIAITFAEGADSEIAHATSQLEQTSHLLNSVAARDLPEENDFSSHEVIQEVRGLCKQIHAEFQFAKIESDKGAGVIAEKNACILFKKAQQLRADAENRNNQIRFATLENQKNFREEARTLNELASVLEKDALAYDQIADLCTVELRKIPQFKKYLTQQQPQFAPRSLVGASEGSTTDAAAENLSTTPIDEMLHELSTLLLQTNLTTTEAPDTFDLDSFLSQLESIQDCDTHAITASNDKIVLTPISSSFEADPNHQSFNHATQLIRKRIFEEHGSHALQRFDRSFAGEIKGETPVFVGRLKEFLVLERTKWKNPSSYFIAEHHSIKEMLKIPDDSAEAAKTIKADGSAILSFNPFLTSSTARATLANEKNSLQRGVEVTKTTLQNFLEKGRLLDPVQIQTILRNFDATFDVADPEKQLTVGALKTFTENELKRALAGMTFTEWLSASPKDPLRNAYIWRAITSASIAASSHIPVAAAAAMLFLEQVASDGTALWRVVGSNPPGGH